MKLAKMLFCLMYHGVYDCVIIVRLVYLLMLPIYVHAGSTTPWLSLRATVW